MIWFILYVLFGLNVAYTTTSCSIVDKRKFTNNDLIIWFAFWPLIVIGSLITLLVEEKEE